MNQHPAGPAALPADIAATTRDAAEALFQALRPAMAVARPDPQATALWLTAKMLSAVSGGLDFASVPEADQTRAQWEEAAGLAATITDHALTVAGTGMTAEQAGQRLLDADGSDILDTAGAYAGVINLTPPDAQETGRTLTVTVHDDEQRTLSVTASRGPAPTPRPHTAATLLRTAHHLHQIGATLGELVLEPAADGLPLCGTSIYEVTCEICGRAAGGDVARTVQAFTPWPRQVKVCSVTCARAAHAGEHTS